MIIYVSGERLEYPTLIGLEVKFIPATNTKGSRVKIQNTFTGKVRRLNKDDGYDRVLDQAVDYLRDHEIPIVGITKESGQGSQIILIEWEQRSRLEALGLMS